MDGWGFPSEDFFKASDRAPGMKPAGEEAVFSFPTKAPETEAVSANARKGRLLERSLTWTSLHELQEHILHRKRRPQVQGGRPPPERRVTASRPSRPHLGRDPTRV